MNTVKAVVFDWAGTVVDRGSCAPVEAFIELFRLNGIQVDPAVARAPMGLPKKEHIRAILSLPDVAEQWRKLVGSDTMPADIDHLYDEFLPVQKSMIAKYTDLIPGTAETVAELRSRGIRIGSTTNYTSSMMLNLIPIAARAGFDPECTICANEVPQGRPAPWMALSVIMRLNVYPVFACVKVGDTIADVAEGRNAGMWTVAVSRTGNEMYLPSAEAEARFRAAKVNYVIDSVADLPPVITQISDRIAAGERP